MSKISPFNNWLGESGDPDRLRRLVQLGMAEDLTPIEWLADLLNDDPEWDPMPAMNAKQHALKIYNRLSGGHVQIAIDCYFDVGGFGEPIAFVVSSNVSFMATKHRTYEIPAGLDHYGVAQLIIKTLRDRYSVDSLSESTDNISRLIDLGIVPDRSVAEWVEELTQAEPNLSVASMSTGNTFTVQHGRDKAVVLVRPDYVEIQYSEADSPRSWAQRYGEYQGMIAPGDTNLTIAQKVIDKIKGYYGPVLPESLDRLSQLGMAPELSVLEWVFKLLKDHPDFVIEKGVGFAYSTLLIGRPWAKTDIVIRLIDRVINAQGDTEITKISLAYLDSEGIHSSRYSWTPDDLQIGTGTLGIAKGIVKLLDDYYSRKATGLHGNSQDAPVPGPLSEADEWETEKSRRTPEFWIEPTDLFDREWGTRASARVRLEPGTSAPCAQVLVNGEPHLLRLSIEPETVADETVLGWSLRLGREELDRGYWTLTEPGELDSSGWFKITWLR